jgi:hypothetical protein
MNALLFVSLTYLLIRLATVKCRSDLLFAAVEWASKQTMQIIDTEAIKYLCHHRGPPKIWFHAKNQGGQIHEICLELHLNNVQYVAQLLRSREFSYETKLVSIIKLNPSEAH